MITLPKISGLRNSSRHMVHKIYSDTRVPWLTQSSISVLPHRERIFEPICLFCENHIHKMAFPVRRKMPYTLAQKCKRSVPVLVSEMQETRV